MSEFYSRLSYSFGNEDWKTEHKALKIQPGDRVLCITASGDRPLHLLLDDCGELISIDANKIQNHLMSLKTAAMRNLDFESYLAFLGAHAGGHRLQVLKKLLPDMEPEASDFWMRRHDMISKGVLYEGAIERWTRYGAKLVHCVRGRKLNRLFAFDDIEEQKKFIKKDWDTLLWKKCFDVGLHPFISKLLLKDPGLYANVDGSIKASSYIYNRMNSCLNHCLAKENSLISLFLRGKVTKEAFPPYLTSEGVKKIKPRLDRVKTKTVNLLNYLESCPDKSIDCFSLSDVASYVTQKEFDRLLRAVKRTAKKGARFSIRQFLSGHSIPEDLKHYYKRDTHLEHALEKEDRCFVYRFIVGKIEV